jgi:hypothetical protein
MIFDDEMNNDAPADGTTSNDTESTDGEETSTEGAE